MRKGFMRCPDCDTVCQILFRKWAKRRDGTFIRPIPPKKCLTIPACKCWMETEHDEEGSPLG